MNALFDCTCKGTGGEAHDVVNVPLDGSDSTWSHLGDVSLNEPLKSTPDAVEDLC